MAESLFETIAAKYHAVLARRADQLRINLLALGGGREYVKNRLSRFPAESTIGFEGTTETGLGRGGNEYEKVSGGESGSKDYFAPVRNFGPKNVTGRRERAYLINVCGRLINKQMDYVFASPPVRENGNEEFLADVTREGDSANQFWREVGEKMIAARWCWVSVDGPEPPLGPDGMPLTLSVAEAEEQGVRPYWSVYDPLSVVDWCYDAAGNLKHVLTDHIEYSNDDPEADAEWKRFRILWQPGSVRRFNYGRPDNQGEAKIESVTEAVSPPPVVPFVRVGRISAAPYWFDDAESIMRAMMDLASANHESLYKQVYPQLILPAGTVEMPEGAAKGYNETADMILGLESPIEEDPDSKGITRYITPTAADLAIIRADLDAMKRDFWEVVGDAIKKESRQVESAEAKALDRIDIETLLCNRAMDLQEGEEKLIALTLQIDPSFNSYDPVYNKEFDVGDFAEEIKGFIGLTQLEAPAVALREAVRSAYRKARRRGMIDVDDQKMAEIEAGFDDMDVDSLVSAAGALEDLDPDSPEAVQLGKIPLAIQQLALARERAIKSGDETVANQIGAKIEELTARI